VARKQFVHNSVQENSLSAPCLLSQFEVLHFYCKSYGGDGVRMLMDVGRIAMVMVWSMGLKSTHLR